MKALVGVMIFCNTLSQWHSSHSAHQFYTTIIVLSIVRSWYCHQQLVSSGSDTETPAQMFGAYWSTSLYTTISPIPVILYSYLLTLLKGSKLKLASDSAEQRKKGNYDLRLRARHKAAKLYKSTLSSCIYFSVKRWPCHIALCWLWQSSLVHPTASSVPEPDQINKNTHCRFLTKAGSTLTKMFDAIVDQFHGTGTQALHT